LNRTLDLLLVAAVAILPSFVGSLAKLIQPAETRRRLEAVGGSRSPFPASLNHPEGLPSVGLRLGHGDIVGDAIFDSFIIAGSIVAALLIVTLLRRSRSRRMQDLPPERFLEFAYHKTRWDRLLYATVLPFSAVAEETVYRGYLVLLFSESAGVLSPWIALSIGLSIMIHLYQGVRAATLLFHIAVASLMIELTLYTGGIEGPIAVHAWWNLGRLILVERRSWRRWGGRRASGWFQEGWLHAVHRNKPVPAFERILRADPDLSLSCPPGV